MIRKTSTSLLLLLTITTTSVTSFTPPIPTFYTTSNNNNNHHQKPHDTSSKTILALQTGVYSDEPLSSRIQTIQHNYESFQEQINELKASPEYDTLSKAARGVVDNVGKEGGRVVKSVLGENDVLNELVRGEQIVEESLREAEGVLGSVIQQKVTALSAKADILQSIKAAEAVAQSAATGASADANAIVDLKAASDTLLTAITNAGKIVEQASKNAFDFSDTNVDKNLASLESQLESAVQDVTTSVQRATSVAQTVTDTASKDKASILKMESSNDAFVQSVAKAEKVAEQTLSEVKEGITQTASSTTATAATTTASTTTTSSESNLVASLETTANEAIRDMKAAESVAESIASKAVEDASAVEKLGVTAENVIAELKNLEVSIPKQVEKSVASAAITGDEGSSVSDAVVTATTASSVTNTATPPSPTELPDSLELNTIITNAMAKISNEQAAVEQVSKQIEQDIVKDETAVSALKSADTDMSKLIQNVDEAVNAKIVDVVTVVEEGGECCTDMDAPPESVPVPPIVEAKAIDVTKSTIQAAENVVEEIKVTASVAKEESGKVLDAVMAASEESVKEVKTVVDPVVNTIKEPVDVVASKVIDVTEAVVKSAENVVVASEESVKAAIDPIADAVKDTVDVVATNSQLADVTDSVLKVVEVAGDSVQSASESVDVAMVDAIHHSEALLAMAQSLFL